MLMLVAMDDHIDRLAAQETAHLLEVRDFGERLQLLALAGRAKMMMEHGDAHLLAGGWGWGVGEHRTQRLELVGRDPRHVVDA